MTGDSKSFIIRFSNCWFLFLLLWFVGLASPLVVPNNNSNNNNNKNIAPGGGGGGAETAYLKPTHLLLHDFPSSGRGVQTLVDREPGDILLKVPRNETITASSDLSSGSGSNNNNNNNDKNDDDQHHQPSYDWQQLSEEQKLSLNLLYLKKKMHHPYVCTVLPAEHFAIWTVPQTIFDARPWSLLPRCYRETFQATREMTFQFAKSVEKQFHMEDVLWAFSMVRSRSIAVPELLTDDDHHDHDHDDHAANSDPQKNSIRAMPLALIPGLDLLNHQFDSGSSLQLVDGQYWTLTSSRSYKAADQIFLSYGDDKDNWKLLLTYGFAVGNNPNAVAFWTWEDLLDAAGAVRPAMFSDHVRRSLLRHPQLKVYVSLTEERATFSLDTQTKLPRESLKNGLFMLSNLATQLGFPQDETLQPDVLDFLIQKRVEDLGGCLSSFSEEDLPEKWIPFMASMKLVLEEELNHLAK